MVIGRVLEEGKEEWEVAMQVETIMYLVGGQEDEYNGMRELQFLSASYYRKTN